MVMTQSTVTENRDPDAPPSIAPPIRRLRTCHAGTVVEHSQLVVRTFVPVKGYVGIGTQRAGGRRIWGVLGAPGEAPIPPAQRHRVDRFDRASIRAAEHRSGLAAGATTIAVIAHCPADARNRAASSEHPRSRADEHHPHAMNGTTLLRDNKVAVSVSAIRFDPFRETVLPAALTPANASWVTVDFAPQSGWMVRNSYGVNAATDPIELGTSAFPEVSTETPDSSAG